jgi:hypothetical protein
MKYGEMKEERKLMKISAASHRREAYHRGLWRSWRRSVMAAGIEMEAVEINGIINNESESEIMKANVCWRNIENNENISKISMPK